MEISSILENFKHKVEKAVLLVQTMESHDQTQAIEHWNEASQQIQDVINSAATEAGLQDETHSLQLRQMDPDRMREYIVATQMATMGITQYAIPAQHTIHEVVEEITMSVMDHNPMGMQVITHHLVQADGTVKEVGSPCYAPPGEEYSDDETVHMTISDVAGPMGEQELQMVTNQERGRRNSDGLYECRFCRKVFNMQSQLTTHVWSHTKPYVCTDCQACFSTRGNLIVHQRSHSGERPFPCPQCGAQFSTKGNLKRHIATHTGDKPWSCQVCSSCFTEKKSLVIHMRIHTGQRPYKCTVCDKAFGQSGVLKAHMAIHLNLKTHLCNKCGVSFRQKSQLKIHELRHGNLRQHECEVCPAKFFTLGEVQRHYRVHTCERPYHCDLCTKSYTRKQSLIEHMHRHNGIKPYRCKYCERCYAEQSACHKHVKSHERVKRRPNKPKPRVTSVAPPDPATNEGTADVKQEAGGRMPTKQEPTFDVSCDADAYVEGVICQDPGDDKMICEVDPSDVGTAIQDAGDIVPSQDNSDDRVTRQEDTGDDIVTNQDSSDRISIQDTCDDGKPFQDISDDRMPSQEDTNDRMSSQDIKHDGKTSEVDTSDNGMESEGTGEDIMTSQDTGDDIMTSQDTGDDIMTSQDTGDDIMTSQDTGDDIMTSQDTGDDIMTSKDTKPSAETWDNGRMASGEETGNDRTSSQDTGDDSATVKQDDVATSVGVGDFNTVPQPNKREARSARVLTNQSAESVDQSRVLTNRSAQSVDQVSVLTNQSAQSVDQARVLTNHERGSATATNQQRPSEMTSSARQEQVVKIIIKTPTVKRMVRQKPVGCKVFVIKNPERRCVKREEPTHRTLTYETLANEALGKHSLPARCPGNQTASPPKQLVAYVTDREAAFRERATEKTTEAETGSSERRREALPARPLSTHEQLIADLANENLTSNLSGADFTAINILANASTYQLHQ